jgi:hypothetical protein
MAKCGPLARFSIPIHNDNMSLGPRGPRNCQETNIIRLGIEYNRIIMHFFGEIPFRAAKIHVRARVRNVEILYQQYNNILT